MKPIFIFSLPRSGSTLLQRSLMGHDKVASVAEPWLLLPLIYSYKKNGVFSEYSHFNSQMGYEDFIKNLPNGFGDYHDAVKEFALDLYSKQCKNDERYFIDKTPRYYLIVQEILKIFPDAKCIFLFRNVLDVFSSMVSTWGKGNLRQLYGSHIDLTEGVNCLSKGYEAAGDRAYGIKYEDFVREPDKYISEIFDYLDLDYKVDALNVIAKQDTMGRLGDPTGVKKYRNISADSLDNWKCQVKSIFRKKLMRSYVNSLDDWALKVQGYQKKDLQRELDGVSVDRLGVGDFFDWAYSQLVLRLKLNILFSKGGGWAKDKHLS